MHRKTFAAVAVVLAAALALTGCSGGPNQAGGSKASTAAAVGAPHVEVDTAFLHEMVLGHDQAIDLARTARTLASSPRVRRLALGLESALRAENATMTGWLRKWGESTPAADMAVTLLEDHGTDSSVPGIMTDSDLNRLGKVHGRAFDRRFLHMVIDNQLGALDLARIEQADGKNPQAMKLARSVEVSGRARISALRQVLAAR